MRAVRGCLVLGSALAVVPGLILGACPPAGAAALVPARHTAAVSARIDPVPIVTIDTQARDGSSTGVRITKPDGSQVFYPASAADWMQVLVLNRSTLDLVSNTSYACPAAAAAPNDQAGHQCAMDLATTLSPLDATSLVIASSPALPSGAPGLGQPIGPNGAATALAGIGVAAWSFWPGDQTSQIRQGLFSAIGVPRSPRGTATESVAASPTAASGSSAITGYLLRDNKGLYEYYSPASFSFDTQAGSSGPNQNVMTVGGHEYAVTIPAGVAGGFQVTSVRQRYTSDQPGPAVTTRWFSTGSGSPPSSFDQLIAMERYLKGLLDGNGSDHQFVLISSRGNPGAAIPADQSFALQVYDAIGTLAGDLTSLGGTRNGAYRVLQGDTGGKAYTLVGQTGSGTGRGYQLEGASTGSAGLNSGVAAGTLTRNGPFYGLALGTTGPAADQQNAGALLEHTVFQAPGDWPEHGNAGRTAAIAWLGQKVYDTTQPRTQYWTIPYSAEVWNSRRRDVEAQSYPQDAAFSQADFDWARDELATEINWLESEHAYLAALAEPFARGALASWASLQSIAGDVNNKVHSEPANKVTESALAILGFGLEVGRELPEPAGEVIGVIGAVYNLAAELTSVNADGTEDAAGEFQSTVGDLGKDLAGRLQDSQDTLTGQFANIVASDYQKLKTVGECASGHRAGCPDDPSRWQFTQDDQQLANKSLQYGAQSTFYSALVGAKYKTYDLPKPAEYDFATPDNFIGHNLDPFAEVCIFKGDPAYSATIAAVVHNSAEYITEHYVSVLGYTTGAGVITDPFRMHWPDSSIVDRMFSPVDVTGDISRGGLGMDREATFALFPNHATLDYFPLAGPPAAKTQWSGDGAAHCISP